MRALTIVCTEAPEGERYRDRLNTFYNRLYKRANKIVSKAQPCSTTRDAAGNVVCAGCAQKDWISQLHSTSPNTLCCKDCEHHGPEGCKASMPLACRTWLCPTAAENNPEATLRLRRLARHASRVGLYGIRQDKSQVLAKRFQAEALVGCLLDKYENFC